MKSSPKVLKTKIGQAEALITATKEAPEALGGGDFASTGMLLSELQVGATTKLSGTLMCALLKTSDADSNRNIVRSEISAMRTKFGLTFDYRSFLSAALNNEIDSRIAMTRRRT